MHESPGCRREGHFGDDRLGSGCVIRDAPNRCKSLAITNARNARLLGETRAAWSRVLPGNGKLRQPSLPRMGPSFPDGQGNGATLPADGQRKPEKAACPAAALHIGRQSRRKAPKPAEWRLTPGVHRGDHPHRKARAPTGFRSSSRFGHPLLARSRSRSTLRHLPDLGRTQPIMRSHSAHGAPGLDGADPD